MQDNIQWANSEIKAKVEAVEKELLAQGFEEVKYEGHIYGSVAFRKLQDKKLFYQGTYMNTFSKDEPVHLYQEKNMEESKSIVITEVHRHNGTMANSSIDLYVKYTGCKTKPEPFTYHYADGTEQTKPVWLLDGSRERIRRFKVTLSEKLQTKMITQAIEKYNAIELKDWSEYELDRKDFPEENEDEYFKAKDKLRQKGKN